MWTEFVSSETIDSRIWPRTAAVAERLWSPREVRDVSDMYRRLSVVSVELEELGLTHEAHSDRMLRRIARSNEIGPLRVLVDAVEPLGFGERVTQQHVSQSAPLTRLVDASHADCRVCLQLPLQVQQLISHSAEFHRGEAELVLTFTQWRDLALKANSFLSTSPILKEAEPRLRQLSQLGETGLEAISYIESGSRPPPEWKERKLALVDEANKPVSLVRLPWLPAFRELVIAAAEVDRTAH